CQESHSHIRRIVVPEDAFPPKKMALDCRTRPALVGFGFFPTSSLDSCPFQILSALGNEDWTR
ncbi:unnamed protein product, partial [Allacma fusca]